MLLIPHTLQIYINFICIHNSYCFSKKKEWEEISDFNIFFLKIIFYIFKSGPKNRSNRSLSVNWQGVGTFIKLIIFYWRCYPKYSYFLQFSTNIFQKVLHIFTENAFSFWINMTWKKCPKISIPWRSTRKGHFVS